MRHRTDWMALLSGLLFIGIGVVYLTDPEPDPIAMLVLLTGGLGLAGVLALVARTLRR